MAYRMEVYHGVIVPRGELIMVTWRTEGQLIMKPRRIEGEFIMVSQRTEGELAMTYRRGAETSLNLPYHTVSLPSIHVLSTHSVQPGYSLPRQCFHTSMTKAFLSCPCMDNTWFPRASCIYNYQPEWLATWRQIRIIIQI